MVKAKPAVRGGRQRAGVVASAAAKLPASKSTKPPGSQATRKPTGSRVTAVHFVARNDTSHLAALVKLVDAGAVRVDIAASRPLADLAAVHRDAESGHTRGKIILVP